MTRTQNSILNFLTGTWGGLLGIVLNFATRTVFIRTLGTSFLGIEGLFSNILSMLSLTELGFGAAIVFKLYKPIEEKNQQRIRVLLKLFRRVYQVIGLSIIVLGLCLIPFLPDLVKDYEKFDQLGLNAVFVFLLYLFGSASSYWFYAYKTSFMEANQKTYILTIVNYVVTLANSLTQILVLLLWHNFIIYLIVQLAFPLLRNLIDAFLCDRFFPVARERTREHISRAELKDFFKDCSSLMLYRINDTVINASDNVILSAMAGLDTVGLYANYLAVKSSIRTLLINFSTAIRASLGSIYTTGNVEWSRLIFRVINFITFWLYGVGAIGVAVLMDDFITIWIGSSYVVSSWTVGGVTVATPLALMIGIELYLIGQQNYCDVCRNTMGLFRQMKFRPIASILINLIVGISTVPYLGAAGCVLGTITASLTTTLLVDPIIIHKHALKQSPLPYFGRNILYILATVAAGLAAWWVCRQIPLDGILGFIVHGCVCVIVPSALFALMFCWSREFHYLMQTLKTMCQAAIGKIAARKGK